MPTGKAFVPKQKPIETRKEEVTTLDPELEEALSSATDTELCDLAGKNEKILQRVFVERLQKHKCLSGCD